MWEHVQPALHLWIETVTILIMLLCSSGNKTADAFGELLEANHILRELDLSWNQIKVRYLQQPVLLLLRDTNVACFGAAVEFDRSVQASCELNVLWIRSVQWPLHSTFLHTKTVSMPGNLLPTSG